MTTMADYFAEHRPKPKYQTGQRVEGVYKGVPFIGTVGADIMVNYDIGPMVTVFVDLPVKVEDVWHTTFIKVKYKDIKCLR